MKEEKHLKKQHLFVITTFSIELEVAARAVGQERETSLTFLKREKKKLSLFTDVIIVYYVENLK